MVPGSGKGNSRPGRGRPCPCPLSPRPPRPPPPSSHPPQGDSLTNPQYRSTLDCLRQTLAVEGSAGLFRGLSAAMYRAIPVNASIFLAVEGTRHLLNKHEAAIDEVFATRPPIPAAAGAPALAQ